ncbi:alpha-L-fucosidase [Amycolatopsis sp. BJA-103]|uniref:alpha-L-fucosidase n=1 Tax=Amycolatopsis sp. BJA-103 TaxID=1911175 RepID=UPI000C772CBD|nr:alpha-L-fucosidase [Amycolatopsis sp. BJA-103]AUI61921.1 alpha-L-fucosidase [Amycolatopsis sp. BJA-103]PNE20783.1 alpha-L-fucosidase [Amycolatopsis sp. BJA-103]
MNRRKPLRALAALVIATTALGVSPAVTQAAPLPSDHSYDDPFTADRTRWWRDDRFGQFIHFGAYSQLQGKYQRPDGSVCQDAEWIQRNCQIPRAEYEQMAAKFNPSGFDANAIAQTAKDAGQKYVVITSKHHEGYAMWPTKVNKFNLRDHSSFDKKRDILAELKRATAARDVKLGFYYSIWDWHDPDFPDPATFPKYKERMYAQLKELVDDYHPAVLWFDGEWSTDRPNNPWSEKDGEELEAYVRSLDPSIVINNRVGKRRVVDGDTGTPEQEIPDKPVDGQLWESCMTLNGSWGYTDWDHNWKSSADLTRKLLSIAGRSGNFLLNVGPDRTGRVPQESVDRLKQMGHWLRTNKQSSAVYGAGAPGLVAEPQWGVVSRRGNKLYASVFDWPASGGSLTLDALAPFRVRDARVLGSGQRVRVEQSSGSVKLTPSGGKTNDVATVIELNVDPLPQAPAGRGTGLTAEYWPNADFTGTPTVRRVEPGVNHNWKFTGSPDAKIPAEAFSSRWSGQVTARDTGKYTFTTVSDDTVRLWVDGKLLVDNTTPHGPSVDKATLDLVAGKSYAIRLDHTERGGEASMKLLWSSPNTPQQVIPARQLHPVG